MLNQTDFNWSDKHQFGVTQEDKDRKERIEKAAAFWS
jgi:hypothetical protein